MIQLSELQTMLDTIVRAIGDPTLRARNSDGREIQYRSMDEALKAKAVIEDQIGQIQGSQGDNTSLAQHRRGDGPSGPPRWYW